MCGDGYDRVDPCLKCSITPGPPSEPIKTHDYLSSYGTRMHCSRKLACNSDQILYRMIRSYSQIQSILASLERILVPSPDHIIVEWLSASDFVAAVGCRAVLIAYRARSIRTTSFANYSLSMCSYPFSLRHKSWSLPLSCLACLAHIE